jgi:hypothetical protein
LNKAIFPFDAVFFVSRGESLIGLDKSVGIAILSAAAHAITTVMVMA